MKPYNPLDWYWIVGGNTTQVYSSKPAVRNYVPVSDPAFVAWIADGILPTVIDSEANLGQVLAAYLLRPIPPAILDGYLDEQLKQFVLTPNFKVFVDVYKNILSPAAGEEKTDEAHIIAQITARIRGLL